MSSSVLITGGAGFIGYHLAKCLLDNGWRVHLVDNCSRGVEDSDLGDLLVSERVRFSRVDLLDAAAVARLPVSFDYVVHLAAIIGVMHVTSRPYNVLIDNINMLANVIAHSKRQQNLKRLMFASTSEVYAGTLEHFELPLPTPEDAPLAVTDLARPRTSDMLSKLCGESLCHYSELPVTIFRPHNVYGPRMGGAHVIPSLLKKMHEATNGDVLAVPSLDQTRCFCYIDDAVELLCRMMQSTDCVGTSLNLGTQEGEVTIREVVEICRSVVGRSVQIEARPNTEGSPARRSPDMKNTYRLTGYRSQIGLREGIAKTYDWYRHQVFERNGVSAV